MNLKTAAYASAFGFVLSFLVALLVGIPFFDVVVRALIWGLVLGALAAGAEALLRSQLPDLFAPLETSESGPREEERSGESVNIVLDEETDRPFVEEIAETGEEAGGFASGFVPANLASLSVAPDSAPSSPSVPTAATPMADAPSSSSEESMPEIGSFLNSFRPPSEGEEAVEAVSPQGDSTVAGSPDIGDYAPQDGGGVSSSASAYAPSKGADLEGMEQDPAILAKAVKSVMSKT